VDLYIAQLSSRTSNALVSSEQIRLKETSETVCADALVPDEMLERVPDSEMSN